MSAPRYSSQTLVQFWASQLEDLSAQFGSWIIEPFAPDWFSHAREGSSAWPPSRAQPFHPLDLFFPFSDPSALEKIRDMVVTSGAHLTNVLRANGEDLQAPYPNYADPSTSVESMYGKNLEQLKALKTQYDPENVMGLAGGWKF